MYGEISRASKRISESAGVAELRPIIGYRDNGWLASFNPVLNMGLSANVSHLPIFEPALKLTHRVAETVHVGAEYYGGIWAVAQLRAGQRSRMLYAVIDVESKGYDVNFGTGRGYVDAGDRWVVKAVVALPFN